MPISLKETNIAVIPKSVTQNTSKEKHRSVHHMNKVYDSFNNFSKVSPATYEND